METYIPEEPDPEDPLSGYSGIIYNDGVLDVTQEDPNNLNELTVHFRENVEKTLTIPTYELPIASDATLGGIKVGANLTIDEDGVLDAITKSGDKYKAGEGITILSGEVISDTFPFEIFPKAATVTQYVIYGTASGVGNLVSGHYEVPIKVSAPGYSDIIQTISIADPLYDGDYIDFQKQVFAHYRTEVTSQITTDPAYSYKKAIYSDGVIRELDPGAYGDIPRVSRVYELMSGATYELTPWNVNGYSDFNRFRVGQYLNIYDADMNITRTLYQEHLGNTMIIVGENEKYMRMTVRQWGSGNVLTYQHLYRLYPMETPCALQALTLHPGVVNTVDVLTTNKPNEIYVEVVPPDDEDTDPDDPMSDYTGIIYNDGVLDITQDDPNALNELTVHFRDNVDKTLTIPSAPLPIASDTTLGGIKVGENLTIDPATGVLDATGGTTYVEGQGIEFSRPILETYQVLDKIRKPSGTTLTTDVMPSGTVDFFCDLKYYKYAGNSFLILCYNGESGSFCYTPPVTNSSSSTRMWIYTAHEQWYDLYLNDSVQSSNPITVHLRWGNTMSISFDHTTRSAQNSPGVLPGHNLFRFDSGSDADLYWAKFYESSALVGELVPVIRQSDSAVGMFNKVTETFSTVSGLIAGTPTGETIVIYDPSSTQNIPINAKLGNGLQFDTNGAIETIAATSANKLNTNAGTVSNPVYFTNGVPTACDYPKSGAWAPAGGGVPFVTSSGVLEIGPYIDFHGTTSTADYDLRLSEESANLLALKNSSPTFRIHSTGHTNAAIELWREGDNYTDYRIINTGGQFKIQSDYIEGTGHTDWFDMLHLAYTTGNATFKGSGTFGGIITTYRESSTTDNLPAGIVFSNKDTTTGLTYSGAHIYAYNDHANPSYGENLVINAGGCLFIGSGEAPDSHYAAIKSGLSTNEDTYMTADRYVYIQGCGSAIAARKGMMVYTTDSNNGNYHQILPTVADTATNNVGSIGSSSYKWNAMYASSYYGEFECLNEVANNTQYAMVLAMNPSTHEPNTLRKSPNAVISFKNGTASEEGWAMITLGNGTASGTAGNETGWIKLYSPSSGSHYITGASTTSTITHTLPTVGGTILNSGNYLQYTRSIQKLYAATSTKGWRRILTIPASNSSGYTIGRYEFHFTRQWNNGPPESFGVRVICNYTTPIIHLLYAEQNSRILTDFRVARSSDSTKIHFEVWYDATTKNDFSVRYVIQDPYLVPHDFCTFPTETDGSSAGSSFLPVVSDSPTGQATIVIPVGGISQFNLRQVTGSYSGYFGMADAAGSDSAWIRTTSQGLLPYQSSNATDGGICSIGTSGWYFKDAYIGKVVSNTADFECFQPRHSNEFSMKQISYNYIWFNYRLITDDKQGYTTEPTNPINQYWFGCGKARNALAKVVTSGMTIYPGAANTTSYSTTLQSASLTANRTATLPNATGTIPLITEKYNSPTSTATSYNLTYATSFKLLMITTKPSSSLFGETTVIVPAPTAAGTTKTYVNWPGVNAEAASQPTRTLGGNIRIRYTNNDTCTIDCVLADYYLQAGASVSSGSTSGFKVYITRVIGISY